MIIDHCRDFVEFLNLYVSIDNSNLPKAYEIVNLGDFCFCFYDEKTEELLGCIYLEDREGKTFLSGFSKRKNYKNIIEAINRVCEHFKSEDIYSDTPFKHAKYVLHKCGFEDLKDNILIKRSIKNGKQ